MIKNMFKTKRQQGGFTLVEMLIAMTIFMSFTGILISSYTGIVRAQRDANSYREMYVQARQVFDTLIQEFRDGMVDYAKVASPSGVTAPAQVYLVSKDAQIKTEVDYIKDDKGLGTLALIKTSLAPGNNPADSGAYILPNTVNLNDPKLVNISKFNIYYSPAVDPYDPVNVRNNANQFHPKVTIYAEFTKDFGNGHTYSMDLQTSVSSRIYSQVYPTNYLYTNIK